MIYYYIIILWGQKVENTEKLSTKDPQDRHPVDSGESRGTFDMKEMIRSKNLQNNER